MKVREKEKTIFKGLKKSLMGIYCIFGAEILLNFTTMINVCRMTGNTNQIWVSSFPRKKFLERDVYCCVAHEY